MFARTAITVLICVAVAGCSSADDDARPSGRAEPAASAPGADGQAGEPAGLLPAEDESKRALSRAEIYRGTGVLARRVPQDQVSIGENGQVTLNFANADIREVVNLLLGDTLKLNYAVDPAVQGTVTVRSAAPLKRAAVLPVLENLLALNGAALSLIDGVYTVLPVERAATRISRPVVTRADRPRSAGFGVNVIPLRYASATGLLEVLQSLVGPGRVLRADPARNILIFVGGGSEAREVTEMVRVFDVDWMAGMSFGLFPVQTAEATTLVGELDAVFGQDGDSPIAGVLRFVPIERLNAILAISPQPRYLDRVATWIGRLDRGDVGAGRRIFVYFVENGRATELAELLGQVFQAGPGQPAAAEPLLAPGLKPVEIKGRAAATGTQPKPATTGTQTQTQPAAGTAGKPSTKYKPDRQAKKQAITSFETEGGIRIIADDRNNALLIHATGSEFRMIESTLKRLDILPLQVLIEATIADVTLNDDLKYGLNWFFHRGDIDVKFGGALAGGLVNAVLPGFSVLAEHTNPMAVLNALSEITDVKVVSSPMLLVLDNQSARLQVGDQVPVPTQETITSDSGGTTTSNAIQLRDTGVILEITPRVNASGLVQLDVVQEVSTVVETTTSELNSPTIQQRKIESTVVVQSGETVALGGLIQDEESEAVSGIPLLSWIPILGHLFKSTTDITLRRELLVLLTPRVVRDVRDARAITKELRGRLKSLKQLEDTPGITFGPPIEAKDEDAKAE